MNVINDYEKLKRHIIRYLGENLSQKRIDHTYKVVDEAIRLARRNGVDAELAEIAALCHDMMRDSDIGLLNSMMEETGMPGLYIDNRNLSHGKAAAIVMERDFGISNREVLNAVLYHTTGRPGMTTLEKIVFLADVIEPSRSFSGIEEIRSAARQDITMACFLAMKHLIRRLEKMGQRYDPITNEAKKDLKKEMMERGKEWITGK
ncbi:MAG: bis(5'-nucleosyl)-tetraphosphatase (symmetrical) YqeK [Anaerovoracaceae bacterium]|jgi:predicted HD superfamily hydrolase involved in NAD metabolism